MVSAGIAGGHITASRGVTLLPDTQWSELDPGLFPVSALQQISRVNGISADRRRKGAYEEDPSGIHAGCRPCDCFISNEIAIISLRRPTGETKSPPGP